MTLDRKSISVIVFPALFFAIHALIPIRSTYRCPNGRAIVLTRRGENGAEICRPIERREKLQREIDNIE